ncbi:phosphotransferase [Frankia gtarii]|uniref:phosphotransferase n=1 Tax=Frankia gtarii TaxID=2950102 RepID=UPI0021BFA8CF|nr:phosphotransferase [Frankia gtarii]
MPRGARGRVERAATSQLRIVLEVDVEVDAAEEALPGGFVNTVVRIGDTVRRPRTSRSEFVHRLLGFLDRQGWPGAPRLLGIDEQNREILSFLDGHVPWKAEHGPAVRSDASLIRVAELVRELHDLTAGTPLAGGHDVVCHNDLSPKNTVYRDLGQQPHPVAFLDWDLAAPGERIHDVAHLCWQFLDLGPSTTEPTEAARRIRLIRDAYGLTGHPPLIETILWWQDRCWRGIEAGVIAGEPAAIRLRDAGAIDQVRAAYHWVAEHRTQLA